MHLNVRSIPKNIDKLNNYLLSLDIQFSIIDLTETWLKEETSELYELRKVFILLDPPKRRRSIVIHSKKI